MRILPPLFCVLLLVSGVSGVEMKKVTLSVMKGDTVTLKPDDAVIPTNEQILWKFEGSIIVNVKNLKDGVFSTFDVADRIIKEKLLLDKQTGSLTITNITTDNTGLYQLEILSKTEITTKKYNVTVHDIVKSLSVLEGDTVTLHTGVKVQGDDQKLWKFGDQGTIIAPLNGAADGKWSNIQLNDQTGELTISNIQSDQTGDYKMEINTSSMILHRKFNINISGGGMKTVSVTKGEPVTLHTGLIEIKGYDLILWKSEGHLMAEINRTTNQFLLFSAEGKFEGRLQREQQSGSLTISDSKTTDSGDYLLHMSNSAYTLQRTISVTVSVLSRLDIEIVIVVMFLVFVLVVIIYNKKCWKRLCRKNGGAIQNPSATELLS